MCIKLNHIKINGTIILHDDGHWSIDRTKNNRKKRIDITGRKGYNSKEIYIGQEKFRGIEHSLGMQIN